MKDTFKNVHTHIFTMDNAPRDFLHLFLPGPVANALDSATNTHAGAWTVAQLMQLFGEQGKRYASFLKTGKSKDQLTVFNELMFQYSDKSMEMVALTLNMDYMGAGLSKTGFEGQIQQVVDIKKQYPERLLIFLGVDPRWKSSATELRKTIESYFETKIESGGKSIYPFAGIKLYPSTGYYVFDQKLKDTFEWAADNGVPVLSHASYLGGIFNYSKQTIVANLNPLNPYTGQVYNAPKFIDEKNIWKWIAGANLTANCKKTCSYFLEPSTYDAVLRSFENKPEKLKICLAHFGGVNQIKAALKGSNDPRQKQPYGVSGINWFNQIRKLIAEHPGAYTDISYDVAEGAAEKDNFLFNTFFDETNKAYGNKIMYGTDFFLAEQESAEKNTYDKFKTYAVGKTLDNGTNFWEQIAKTNINAFLQSKYY
jgi:predicted TIM-barrel fold metal-dependent hydrolase